MKATKTDIYSLPDIAPPAIRLCDSAKQMREGSHPMSGNAATVPRLKTRKCSVKNCFLISVELATEAAHKIRKSLCQQNQPDVLCTSKSSRLATIYIVKNGKC